ncbi:MAG: MATE family efflux transporter [Legionellales bacterium]|nr:MATE family efflux transporter [Legionellales bacterium]
MQEQLSCFKRELKAIFLLASPLVMALLAQMGMDFVDTVMMGRLGPDALAAGALGVAILGFLFVGCMGFGNATGTLMARSDSAGRKKVTIYLLHQALWIAFILSLPCFILLWFVPDILIACDYNPQLVEKTRVFLHALQWELLPGLWFLCLREFVSVANRPRVIMIISIISIPLNALGNYILMYGKLGLPALGIAGIGLSTTIVSILAFLGALFYIASNSHFRRYPIFRRFSWPKLHYMREIIRIGWPISVMLLFEVGLFALASLMIGRFGTIQLAAHQIALQCSSIAFMFPLGIAQATAIRVGRAMATNNPLLARQAGYAGLCLGLICASTTLLFFVATPYYLARIYLPPDTHVHRAVLTVTTTFLLIAGLFQLFDAMQVIMNGCLRGLKDTFIPMLLGLISYWAIGISFAYLCGFIWNLQGEGIWCGLAVGIFVSAILLWLRFHWSTSKLIQEFHHDKVAA